MWVGCKQEEEKKGRTESGFIFQSFPCSKQVFMQNCFLLTCKYPSTPVLAILSVDTVSPHSRKEDGRLCSLQALFAVKLLLCLCN